MNKKKKKLEMCQESEKELTRNETTIWHTLNFDKKKLKSQGKRPKGKCWREWINIKGKHQNVRQNIFVKIPPNKKKKLFKIRKRKSLKCAKNQKKNWREMNKKKKKLEMCQESEKELTRNETTIWHNLNFDKKKLKMVLESEKSNDEKIRNWMLSHRCVIPRL